VYRALPESSRGDFIVHVGTHAKMTEDGLIARAARRNVLAVTEAADPSRPMLVTSWGDHKAARGQGRVRLARMEHGIGQSFVGSQHPSYAGGGGCDDISLFLVPNDHAAKRWQDAYPGARVEVIGCPKLDELPPRAAGPKPIVAVSFHWSMGVPSRTDPLLESHGSFHEYRQALVQLAMRYRVIGHGHPKGIDGMARWYNRFRITVVPDFMDVCRQADLYVCDTNSTIYEFASLGRPVVVVNGKHFRREVDHGLRFWDAAGVGVNCDSPEMLDASVAEALEDRPAQRLARESALGMVYAHRTGAAERAAKALTAWAGKAVRRVAA
jgi:hypothetical protein